MTKFAIFCLAAFCFCANAQSSFSAEDAETTFKVHVLPKHGNDDYDLVLLDSTKGTLIICRSGSLSDCRSHQTSAIDLVQMPDVGAAASSFLLLDKFGYPRQCSFVDAGGALDCSPTSAKRISETVASIEVSMDSALLLSIPQKRGATQCGSLDRLSMKCTAVREIQGNSGGFIAGSFSAPNTQELLVLKGGNSELCDLSKTPFRCRKLSGLPPQSILGKLAGAKVMKDTRHALIALSDRSFATCNVGSVSSSTAYLNCSEQETALLLSDARMFVVPSKRAAGLEKIQLLSKSIRKNTHSSSDQAGIVSENNQIIKDPLSRLGEEIVAQANSNTSEAFLEDSHRSVEPNAMGKLFNPGDESGQYEVYPFYSQYWSEDDGWGTDFWSDIWDRYSWDWDSLVGITPRDKCVMECDAAMADDTMTCAFIAGGIAGAGLSITVGATVGALITGPGAGAVFMGGIAATADVTAVTSGLCIGWAAWQRYKCVRRC
jgi:hypothetical protein